MNPWIPLVLLSAIAGVVCGFTIHSRWSVWLGAGVPWLGLLAWLLYNEFFVPYRGGGASMWPVAQLFGGTAAAGIGAISAAIVVRPRARPLLLLLIGLGVAGIVGLHLLFDPAPNMSIAPEMRVKADLFELKKRLIDYRSRNGVYPDTEQWWQALGLDSSNIRDSWGNDYIYRRPGTRSSPDYDLFSAGPDRLPDTADDEWGQ